MLTAFLFFIFGQMRTGATNGYSAVFADASRLEAGDTVRVAGIRVGTVQDVSLQSRTARCWSKFDADRNIVLTTGTKAAIRYLNLVGDRYLELVDSPGSTKILPVGSQIPEDRTAPALDLDLLLGGLKPVIQGLNPQDVNALIGVADSDAAGPRRNPGIAVLEDVVVHELAGGQQPGDRAVDRGPARAPSTPCRRTATNSPARSTDSSNWSGAVQRPRSHR